MLAGNRELASLFAPAKPRKPPPDFKVRSMHDDLKVSLSEITSRVIQNLSLSFCGDGDVSTHVNLDV